MEMATFPFLKEFDLRPNSIFIRYLDDYKKVAGTVWDDNKWYMIVTLVLLFIVHRFAWRSFKNLIIHYQLLRCHLQISILTLLIGLLF